MIEERRNAMNKGEEVPDDILQHIIKQQGLLVVLFTDHSIHMDI